MIKNVSISDIIRVTIEAGTSIMDIYNAHFVFTYRDDKFHLTEADKMANLIICKNPKDFYLDIPIISEESEEVEHKKRRNFDYFCLIDPVDDTKKFIQINGEPPIALPVQRSDECFVMAASKSHNSSETQQFINRKAKKCLAIGTSLKMCLAT